VKTPKPVSRPERAGTIQGMEALAVQPSQKSPAAKETPPTMDIGIRHSGTGMLSFAFRFRTYLGFSSTTATKPMSSPALKRMSVGADSWVEDFLDAEKIHA